MPEYEFSLTRIFPQKDRSKIKPVKEKPYFFMFCKVRGDHWRVWNVNLLHEFVTLSEYWTWHHHSLKINLKLKYFDCFISFPFDYCQYQCQNKVMVCLFAHHIYQHFIALDLLGIVFHLRFAALKVLFLLLLQSNFVLWSKNSCKFGFHYKRIWITQYEIMSMVQSFVAWSNMKTK